jgi:phage-related protein
LQLDTNVWAIHAFQKKSIYGIKTPKHEIDLVKELFTIPLHAFAVASGDS